MYISVGVGIGSSSVGVTDFKSPVLLSATGVGSYSLTVGWRPYPGAVTYYLDFSESPTFDTFILAEETINAPATSYTVIGLQPETTYYYRMRANTLIAQVSTDIGSNSFIASWVEYTGAGNYLLDVSTSETFDTFVLQEEIIDGSLTSYEVTGLDPETTYYYRVKANSVFAKIATNANVNTFTANWEAYAGAVSYLLDVSTSETFDTFVLQNQVVDGSLTSYEVTGIQSDTTYYYRVRANSLFAKVATDIGVNEFTANWQAYPGAVSYLLDVSESSDFSTFVLQDQQVDAPSTSYVVTGLDPETTYYYRVRASTD